MIWLVALAGNWGYAYGGRMLNFPTGVYQADPVTERYVRAAGPSPQLALVESEERPRITSPPPTEPWRNLRGWEPSLVLPAGATVLLTGLPDSRILRPHEQPTPSADGERRAVPLDFPCPRCERRFPSKAALDLHAEFEHGAAVQAELDAIPKPEPVEPELYGTGLQLSQDDQP